MGHVNADRFKKLADAVASDFVTQDIPLNTSIHKLAQSMDMNHEQIRRLCEAANNATFNQIFSSKDKTAADRIVEFDVADPDKIVGSFIREAAPVSTKHASLYEYRELARTDEGLTKVAEVPLAEPAASTFTYKDKNTVRKMVDNLRMEKMSCELAYADAVALLDKSFKRLYDAPSFDTFQKEACQLHGPEALPELNALRERRGLAAIESFKFSKTASVIDDSSAQAETLTQLIALRKKIARAAVATKNLEKLL